MPKKEQPENMTEVNSEDLMRFIERRERLAEEKKDISDQEKEVNAEMKGRGYSLKHVNKIIALRKQRPDQIAADEAELEVYKIAAGLL